VQVRLPARHTVLGAAARGKVRIECVVEPNVGKKGGREFRVWAAVSGMSPERMGALVDALRARYGAVHRDGDRLVGDIPAGQLQDSILGALLALQSVLGPPWLVYEKGHVHMRAEATGDPDEAVQRLRRTLAFVGVRAEPELVAIPAADLERWQQLAAWRDRHAGEDLDLVA